MPGPGSGLRRARAPRSREKRSEIAVDIRRLTLAAKHDEASNPAAIGALGGDAVLANSNPVGTRSNGKTGVDASSEPIVSA